MKTFTVFIASSLGLFGLPVVGVLLSGRTVPPYPEFPPLTRYVMHAPFSWPRFGVFAAVIGGAITPSESFCAELGVYGH